MHVLFHLIRVLSAYRSDLNLETDLTKLSHRSMVYGHFLCKTQECFLISEDFKSCLLDSVSINLEDSEIQMVQ